jgi:hypothetical protein
MFEDIGENQCPRCHVYMNAGMANLIRANGDNLSIPALKCPKCGDWAVSAWDLGILIKRDPDTAIALVEYMRDGGRISGGVYHLGSNGENSQPDSDEEHGAALT